MRRHKDTEGLNTNQYQNFNNNSGCVNKPHHIPKLAGGGELKKKPDYHFRSVLMLA